MAKQSAITIEDLVSGMVEQFQYANAHEHLKSYFDHRAHLLSQIFDCNLERSAKELDRVYMLNFQMAIKRGRKGPSMKEIEARYAVSGRGTVSFLKENIRMVNMLNSSGSVYLEGMPPKIERDLQKKYGPAIAARKQELTQLYRSMILETLEFLFPGIGEKTYPAEILIEMGLPRDRPDPDEYF